MTPAITIKIHITGSGELGIGASPGGDQLRVVGVSRFWLHVDSLAIHDSGGNVIYQAFGTANHTFLNNGASTLLSIKQDGKVVIGTDDGENVALRVATTVM